MDKVRLQREAAFIRSSLLDQGYLDEQFIQLEELQDNDNPNFVEEVVTLFYTDSARLIYNIDQALLSNPTDFTKLDDYMHQFKGSCSRCFRTFQQIKQEYINLKKKLETYFQLLKEAAQIK
ncbi:pseudo histidine-containing phosphotransfer protein 5-like isoform X2 [Arachis stenosperma]|uniref:pseudo histidine-containing phosphotransfer protein 5-like isoform X2 n=1 Tax=Arachis stenosperma TaxID=217475 RepID=UPI0025AB9DE4|nr:pseudo histidine-containing phosphotransfer protein 5-like isoform X2 [Arachis stenosperma]